MEDVNYHHLMQVVDVEPNATYRLSGYIKTANLTTDSGARIEVYDVTQGLDGPYAFAYSTPDVRGTNDWTYVEVTFTTLPTTTKVSVRLRRYSDHGPVSGVAWFDDVSLTGQSG